MRVLLLDTHALVWMDSQPNRLSETARSAIEAAEQIAVADITWYELCWLTRNGRVTSALPTRAWLTDLAANVLTVPITPAIADTAASLASPFPGDPADRLIYATAVETGSQLVTKDRKLRAHPQPRPVTLW